MAIASRSCREIVIITLRNLVSIVPSTLHCSCNHALYFEIRFINIIHSWWLCLIICRSHVLPLHFYCRNWVICFIEFSTSWMVLIMFKPHFPLSLMFPVSWVMHYCVSSLLPVNMPPASTASSIGPHRFHLAQLAPLRGHSQIHFCFVISFCFCFGIISSTTFL